MPSTFIAGKGELFMTQKSSVGSPAISTEKIFSAAVLVQYQDGAIVSREIMRKEMGTVTVFAFDQGQGLSEHTSPYDATVQVVDGAGAFTVGGETRTVRTGELLIMPANIPHAVHADERFKMLLIMIRSKVEQG